MADIATQIKQLRLNAKMTQKELATRLGVSQNAVFNWENGKREPSAETIEKIAFIFDVLPEQIMGWDREYAEIGAKIDAITEIADEARRGERALSDEQARRALSFVANLMREELDLERKIDNSRQNFNLLRNDNEVLNLFHTLNETGQNKAIEQIELLIKIPEYRKEPDEPPQEPEPDDSHTPK